jgi:hypothetical protein
MYSESFLPKLEVCGLLLVFVFQVSSAGSVFFLGGCAGHARSFLYQSVATKRFKGAESCHVGFLQQGEASGHALNGCISEH